MASPSLLELLSGTAGFVLLVFMTALSVYWLLFPLLVYSKLNRIAKTLEALRKETEDAREWMKQTAGERLP